MNVELVCITIDDLKEELVIFKDVNDQNYYYISLVLSRINIPGGFDGACKKVDNNMLEYSSVDEMIERFDYIVAYLPDDDLLNIVSDDPNNDYSPWHKGGDSYEINNVSTKLKPFGKDSMSEYPKTVSIFRLI